MQYQDQIEKIVLREEVCKPKIVYFKPKHKGNSIIETDDIGDMEFNYWIYNSITNKAYYNGGFLTMQELFDIVAPKESTIVIQEHTGRKRQ